MDYLKDGIGLRAMAQRDPLVEYQREGYAMFQQMMGRSARRPSASSSTSRSRSRRRPAPPERRSRRRVSARQGASDEKLSYSAPSDAGGVEVRNQRGQVQQAATQRARRAVAQRARRPRAERVGRGAFGQRTGRWRRAPQNRAERRAQDRKGR